MQFASHRGESDSLMCIIQLPRSDACTPQSQVIKSSQNINPVHNTVESTGKSESKIYLKNALTVFPPFYAKRANCYCRSLLFSKDPHDRLALVTLFKRANVSELIPSIFNKEPPWAIRSRRSLKKSDGSVLFFFIVKSIFHSFDHKKQAICSKNRWSNSQPWLSDI